MCPILLVHKQYIQTIQVAATPLQRGVVGGRTVGEGGEGLEQEGWEDNRREEVGEALDFVPSTTVRGCLQGRLALCHGLCGACALFCSCYQNLHVHLCLSPSPVPFPSSSPAAPPGSPCLCGCCDSSALFARSSTVLLDISSSSPDTL